MDVVKYADVEKPQPAAGEVLIKVKASALNPQDYKIRNGLGDYLGLKFPIILGCEIAGVIEAVGGAVDGFQTGDSVYGFITTRQAHAEYVAAKTEDIAVMPKSLNYEEAAAIPVGALTAWRAIFDTADLQSGQTILMIGASGGVGSIAVQLAKTKGARVVAVASGRNAEFVKNLGADEFIDYRTQDFTRLVKDADVVLDLVGGASLEKAYQSVKKDGFVVTLPEAQPIEELEAKYGIRSAWSVIEPSAEKLTAAGKLADEGKIKPHVEKVFDLSEARQALTLLEKGEVSGKIVLRVN